MKKWKFSICFEGPTGAGKTTLAIYLTKKMKDNGIDARYVKLSPSHNLIGRIIRRTWPTSRLYPIADIGYLLDNFVEVYKNGFLSHGIVIYDKSPYNIVAFWKVLRNGRYATFLESLTDGLYSFFQPDIMFYLTAEYEERRNRIMNKTPRSRMDELLIQPNIDKEITKYLYHYCSRAHNKNLEYIDTTEKKIEEIGAYVLNRVLERIREGK